MPRVLFIATHRPDRSPSQRFRFEQYLLFLKENNWNYDFSYLISENADKVFYKKGHFIQKIFITLKAFFIRFKNILNASKYDLIFIQREAFFTGTTFFEKQFKKSKAKIIFDFDDSIWLSNVSDANKKWEWLKNPNKTKEIITLSDMVFAGNEYLANYAKQANKNVVVVPTTIDTLEYTKVPKNNIDKICIGWSGSITTIQHFEFAVDFLTAIKEKYQNKVYFKVIGDGNYKNKPLEINGLPWKKETEIEELSSFDIGIMPLPNDEWASGKCGLKGLQYMALEIPTIMSPVGVNSEIIKNGENGFLAETKEEWIDAISQLIESDSLRKKLGQNARKTVSEKYSVKANKKKYLDTFNSLLK